MTDNEINLPLLETVKRSFYFVFSRLSDCAKASSFWFWLVFIEILLGYPSLSGSMDTAQNMIKLASSLLISVASAGIGAEICRNIITIAKENSGNLLSIQMRSGQDETDMDNYTTAALLGDNYCTNNPNQCLRYAGLTEMDTLCNSCDSDVYCAFFVFIDVKH